MKIRLITNHREQLATATEVKTYEGLAGEVLDLPDDIAVLFLNAGAAEPLKTEKAVKSKGEVADK